MPSPGGLKVLIVKLSSLGDVVHAMPALQDMRRAEAAAGRPEPVIDWVVERSFAPLVRRCAGVRRTIECELRRWRRSAWQVPTRLAWRAFLAELRAQAYDAVIDLQGLTKSAVVARLARLGPQGRRYALANRTEGSSYEAPARWLAHVAIRIEPHVHVVQRGRELCARALDYPLPPRLDFGLRAVAQPGEPAQQPFVLLVHGSSRADKLWPEAHWIELGTRIMAGGDRVALVHGSDEEQARSRRIAASLGRQAMVWPRMELDALLDRMALARGVIGVDSGLSHLAVALDLPHVQIYNFETAWRTGPIGVSHQQSAFALPTPGVDAVWGLWQQVLRT